jgi:steroid 5-alpha reductase family enzyme
MSLLLLVLLATAGLLLVFAAVFLVARRLDNYGIVDVAWSYAFTGLALFYALAAGGWGPRRALIATLVTLWSLRLGTHLSWRVMGHHPVEDSRYQQLRRDWAADFPARMYRFFQYQALSVVLLGLPFLLAALHGRPGLHPLEWLGLGVWLAGWVCESVADRQLAAFRRDPARAGQVCDRGLWAWSRHPNYFGEWLIWVGFALIALAAPWGWLGLIAPLGILHLLLNVTGVPTAEASSLRSKGEAYRAYQRRVARFFPRPPRPA